MYDNWQYVFGSGERSYLCTVVANNNNLFRYASSHFGTIFQSNVANSTYYSALSFAGCMAWQCSGFPESAGLSVQDPCFVDAAHGDFRPLSLSPAVAGPSGGASAALSPDWWVWTAGDIEGNPLHFADGKVTLGAYHTSPLAVVVSGKYVSPVGTNAVERGESLVVTATNVGRELKGFVVDGVLRPVGEGVRTISITNSQDGATGFVSVSAAYAPSGLMLLFR
jgi:hypothetical protein